MFAENVKSDLFVKKMYKKIMRTPCCDSQQKCEKSSDGNMVDWGRILGPLRRSDVNRNNRDYDADERLLL